MGLPSSFKQLPYAIFRSLLLLAYVGAAHVHVDNSTARLLLAGAEKESLEYDSSCLLCSQVEACSPTDLLWFCCKNTIAEKQAAASTFIHSSN